MKYIVYITINKENDKIYIGVHKTENPEVFDGYIGNGIYTNNPSTIKNPKTKFQFAVKKYGFNSFRRYILAIVDTEEEALLIENLLVNKTFLNRCDVYNSSLGGGLIYKDLIPINKFSLNGELIKKYKSITEAAEDNNLSIQYLSLANKNKKSYNNFFWSTEETINIKDFSIITTDQKTVYKFDTNCNLVKVYSSTSEAAKDSDTIREVIRDCIYKMTLYNKHYYSYNPTFNPKEDPNIIIYIYNLDGNFKEKITLGNLANNLNMPMKKLYKIANSGLCVNNIQLNIKEVIKMQDKTLYKNPGIKRAVDQFDLEGNFIKTWNTVTECSKEFSNAKKVLSGKIPSTKGYVFKYHKEFNDIV